MAKSKSENFDFDGVGDDLNGLGERLKKDFAIQLKKASELVAASLIPTGIFTIDYANGGGIPDHAQSMFHGQKSSGKTTTALNLAREVLIKYPDKEVLYGAIEKGAFDKSWAEAVIGSEYLDRVRVIDGIQYGEEWAATVEDAIELNKISLIITDSIPALLPEEDVERAADEESRMGANARMCKLLMKKYNKSRTYLEKKETEAIRIGHPYRSHIPAMLNLNQRRELVGSRLPAASIPGGKELQHNQILIMEFKGSSLEEDGKDVVRSIHNFNLGGGNNRNKATGVMIKTGEFEIATSNLHPRVNRGHVDDYATVVKFAKEYGFLTGAGAGQQLAVLSDEKFRSQADIANRLVEDEEVFWLLKACIIAKKRLQTGLPMMPPDDYLQRCTSYQIKEVFDRVGFNY